MAGNPNDPYPPTPGQAYELPPTSHSPYADPFASPHPQSSAAGYPPPPPGGAIYGQNPFESSTSLGPPPPQRGYALSDEAGYSSMTVNEDKYGQEGGYNAEYDDPHKPFMAGGGRGDYGQVGHHEEDEYEPSLPTLGGRPGRGGTNLTRQQTNAEWARRQNLANLGRAKTTKVKLHKGNYVIETPVPGPVREANSGIPGTVGNEFTHMRYTAATCDPDEFTIENGWELRQNRNQRHTDLLIAITVYNEHKVLLTRTLYNVMTNIRDIVKDKVSEFRKKNSQGVEGGNNVPWQNVVVTLVFDGVGPADKQSLDVLATIGLYADSVMRKDVNGQETVCHIFEYTTRISVKPDLKLQYPHNGDFNDRSSLVPVQMILCLKQQNSKKINSHRWLFNALGRQLNPDICILLDAGTKPGPWSLYFLWEAFYHNKHLGGACGEIHAMLGKGGKKLINPLVAAQNFEYKMSNVLDKPTESAFGYVSVLPGAFSAYRFEAIQGRPLSQYFHGDHTLGKKLGKKGIEGMGIFKKNMFLAEDRILCFELVAKAGQQWVLGYVKPAKGETDVPEAAYDLIGQRRRWLNGSFAAGVYALFHFPRMYKSGHGIFRMFFLHVQALYNTVNLFMSWFALGNFWLTFSIIIDIVAENLHNPDGIAGEDERKCWEGSVFDKSRLSFDVLGQIAWALKFLYLVTLLTQVVLALGNRPKAERLSYAISFWVFAICQLWLIINTVYLTVKAFCPIGSLMDKAAASGSSSISVFFGSTYGPIFAGLAGTFGVYIISSLLYLEPWHLFHSMPQYLLIAPSFINILNVYAFANLHDVSWGTKGSDSASEKLPSVTTAGKKGEETVEVTQMVQEDIDTQFKATVERAVSAFHETEEAIVTTMDDQNRTFRTRLLIVWLISNIALSLAIGRLGNSARTVYFQIILWVTFGLSVVRLAGFLYYMFGEVAFRLARICTRGIRGRK